MKRKFSILLFSLLFISTALKAQKPARILQYYPEGKNIVCINGNNRYTRALYGTHTLFRLETSDRPVFATYDKQRSHNFRFFLVYKKHRFPLDSTSYCEARYQGGQRTYLLRDPRWGREARLTIVVLVSQFREGAIWHFSATGFNVIPQLEALVCPVRKWNMSRDGDLGKEPRSSYDPQVNSPLLRDYRWQANGNSYFVLRHPDTCYILSARQGASLMKKEQQALTQLTSVLSFTTPDPFINTLASNLVVAADGLWDGKTWLHGCVGWRMPLAGWRAGYVGDILGWDDRARSHFDAYARSQVTDIPPVYPHPNQDTTMNFSRIKEKWGTQMYSNGYICRLPDNNHIMHHYDMNLNYIDELLWHFEYDADTTYLRKMWPVLVRHLAWEKRNWDPDNDHLYDAYCCIWASDALYYNSGAVTYSSAYNYRGNLLAARIAEILGKNPAPYLKEAEAIKKAMNARLWVHDHWVEYQDFMGLKRLHTDPGLWSLYTPIDCGVDEKWQDSLLANYLDRHFRHIPVGYIIPDKYKGKITIDWKPYTISTTDWMPYDWSTNNVAHEEVANMALALYEAGQGETATRLLKSDLLDEQYLGQSPGNFGQISYYDKAVSEAYRDFGDNIGVVARAVVNGLFGIRPDALHGKCVIRPGWPSEWKQVSFHSPYLSFYFHRDGRKDIFRIHQHFAQPLQMILDYDGIVEGTDKADQTLIVYHKTGSKANCTVIRSDQREENDVPTSEYMRKMGLKDLSAQVDLKNLHYRKINIDSCFNSKADNIFKNEYFSPRSPYSTLEIPSQGIGQWCVPNRMADINDKIFRSKIHEGIFDAILDSSYVNSTIHHSFVVPFQTPSSGKNIIYTSLWNNYPDSATVALQGKAQGAWLMLAGSTNSMQSRIANGIIYAEYTDGSKDTLILENPDNWCPVEQDYYTDDYAFKTLPLRPYRVHFGSGAVSRNLTRTLHLQGISKSRSDNPDSAEGNNIPDGAAELLCMPLDKNKELKSLTLRALSNDVVIGLMAVTLF